MKLIPINDPNVELSAGFYDHLESGDVLFFPRTPINLTDEDYRFLLSQRQADASYFKNVAYRPAADALTGVARGGDKLRLHAILKNYCQQATEVLKRLLPRYAAKLKLDFATYRPLEEAGRKLSLHARNDLLHFDAFPTRPTHGDRILRFFTNINPEKPRIWLTTESFEALAARFAHPAGLDEEARKGSSSIRRSVARVARRIGWGQMAASPYDKLMHRFHNFLKENQGFQEECPKERTEFPPQTSWLVFTDAVSHAVLAGQFALEQTFILPYKAMLHPERAPVSVFERLAGTSLTWRK